MLRRITTIAIIVHHTFSVAVFAFDPFVDVGVQRLHIDTPITIMQTNLVASAVSDRSSQPTSTQPIHASLAQGTTITVADDRPLTLDQVTVESSVSQPFHGKTFSSFHFGTRDKHLMFSKPVRLDIPVSRIDDDSEVLVLSHHVGDVKYSQTGLTSSARAECLSDGSSSSPLGPTIVRNGIVTVYTCGASDFVVTYTGGANDANFVDNGTKTKTITVTAANTAGENTITNLRVIVDFHSINGTDPANPGAWFSYSSEMSLSLTSPSGTTINLINTNTYGINNAPRVAVTFDDDATDSPSGTPSTGTFRPADNLSAFDGETALGDWTFTFGDNAGGDGLIIHKVDLNFSTNNVAPPSPPTCKRVTYTGGADAAHFVDNQNKTFPINVTSTAIEGNTLVEILKVSVDFHSIDGVNPLSPLGGNAYSNELSMKLTSPSGTVCNIVNANTYGRGNAPRTLVVFDDTAANNVSGVPISGTFKPQQSFSVFSGENAIGDWNFELADNSGGDGVILYAVYLDLCYTSTPPTGSVTISAVTGINLGSHQPLSTLQTIDTNTTAAFGISDTLGSDAGRYTTLQASNLTAGTETIPAANILISHPGAITTASGTANPLLGFGSTIATSYVALSTPITYIKRDAGPNGGVTGSYTTNPSLRVIVPDYQAPGDYTSTITYTLYEN